MFISFDREASKHGLTEGEAREALADAFTREFEIQPSNAGNLRVMYIGETLDGRLLEIGIEGFETDDGEFLLHVFHMDDATLEFERRYHKP